MEPRDNDLPPDRPRAGRLRPSPEREGIGFGAGIQELDL